MADINNLKKSISEEEEKLRNIIRSWAEPILN